MSKYRIKEKYINGNLYYIPQYKWCYFFWFPFIDASNSKEFFIKCLSLGKAKNEIDNFLVQEEKRLKEKRMNKQKAKIYLYDDLVAKEKIQNL